MSWTTLMCDYLWALPILCSAASLLASMRLLRHLHNASLMHHRKRLMNCQLWHLAVGDVTLSVCIVVNCFMRGFMRHINWVGMDAVCWVVFVGGGAGMMTPSLVEVHLSLSLLLTLVRSERGLDFLWRILPAVWPLGTLFAVWSTFRLAVAWIPDDGCVEGQGSEVVAVVEASCVIFAACTYLSSSYHVMCGGSANQSVRNKVYARVQSYLLTWFVCSVPDAVRLMMPEALCTIPWLTACTMSLVSLNGLLNTIVYANQRIEAQKLRNGSMNGSILMSRGPRHSFLVSLGTATVHHPVVSSSDMFDSVEFVDSVAFFDCSE